MTAGDVLERKDVPQESKWNSKAVFASWAEWKAEAEAVESALPQLAAFEGQLTEGPAELADWLTLVTGLDRRVMRLYVYAFMANSADANDMAAKEGMGRVMGLYAAFKAASAFAEPAMLELGDTLLDWAEEEERLTLYDHYFDNLLRQKAHRRSAEVEELLGLVQEPFGQSNQTFGELTNLEMTFADAQNSQGEPHAVVQATVPPRGIQEPDRELRRTAWENYCDGYLGLKHTLASSYITSVKQNIFLARARGYIRCWKRS
jgi:oligoendopeptidase F